MKTIPFSSSCRGSTIILVLILVVVFLGLTGSLMRWATSETSMHYRSMVRTHSQYGAEAVLENAHAQLVRRFMSNTSIPRESLNPQGETSLNIPPMEFFQGSFADYESIEMIPGLVGEMEWSFIDPEVMGNRNDSLAGMHVLSREIGILVSVTARRQHAVVTTKAIQYLQVRDAPLFAHAIYYNMDMEIAPGPDFDVFGSVHVNGNVYFQSNNTLNFHNKVNATGNFYRGRRPGVNQGASNGTVRAMNWETGQLRAFTYQNKHLDSTHAQWRQVASDMFRGGVRSQDHGVVPSNPVAISGYVEGESNPAIVLIQPPLEMGHPEYDLEIENQKFSRKASLYIRVNPDIGFNSGEGTGKQPEVVLPSTHYQAWVIDGNDPDPITNGREVFLPEGLLRTRTGPDLYDAREKRHYHVVNFDVSMLRKAINGELYPVEERLQIQNFNPEYDWNGIVYVENLEPQAGALRVVNGQVLPSRGEDIGFTLATNGAMYVQGHYNADGNPATGSSRYADDIFAHGNLLHPDPSMTQERPAALISDAITFLSPAWDDALSTGNLTNRRPVFTEVAAAVITGIVPSLTSGGNYSGGVENLPRFLENWNAASGNNRIFRVRGSFVVLYESEQATGLWGGNNVYGAPNRDWGFNALFGTGAYPPGTPNTRSYRLLNYRELNPEDYAARKAELYAAYGIEEDEQSL